MTQEDRPSAARSKARLLAASLTVFMVLAMSTTRSSAASPGTGVSHELAISRAARVSALHYRLALTLTANAERMSGHESLRFSLSAKEVDADLPIDFRDGTLTSATLNGAAVVPSLVDGHLILPGRSLRSGENRLEVDFTSRVAAAGSAITHYQDTEDNSEYLYSLFVPMDASMAFPCFDQPDLKASFELSMVAPGAWTIISNTAPRRVATVGDIAHTEFAETRPISTYLFAFAAGPWVKVHPTPGEPDVYVRRSQVNRATPEIPQLQQITARGMAWLSDYFHQPFPFAKYDIVLIPGFPFGGMEHAGATFLREDGVLFRSAPTVSDRFQRNILTLHELTHQWFGDLVTMRWFDDLWLKEGFAQYMAYHALDALEPGSEAWKHFYEDIKPQAYGIDETEGTTPIFQNIPNLKDAKSAYGAIVYQKAPSILKQLEFRVGDTAFRDGLRLYLQQHAYGNAQWSDLVSAFHVASGQDVRSWADAWVLRRGMPEVSVSFTCDAQSRIARMTLRQQDVLPDNFVWPISSNLLLRYPTSTGSSSQVLRVDWNTAEAQVSSAVGRPCPAYVFANAGDEAYGRFLLDARSEPAVRASLEHAPSMPDPLQRSMLWGALWDNVHTARSDPRQYIQLVLATLPEEQDETLARIDAGHATTALQRYLSDRSRATLVPQLETIVTDRMLRAPTIGLRIISFRTLTNVAETPAARDTLKQLLAAKLSIAGVDLRPLDRWGMVSKLIALGDPEAQSYFAAEQQHDKTGDAAKYAWAAQAAAPDAATKQRYFAEYLRSPTDSNAKPEDWLTQSLRPFNSWNQSTLTEPYLGAALDQLPEIKRDRKIFFLGAWLGAFLGGQQSSAAEAVVAQWLSKLDTEPEIHPDLRLKVLENVDELHRTVRIRQTFPDYVQP